MKLLIKETDVRRHQMFKNNNIILLLKSTYIKNILLKKLKEVTESLISF